MKKSHLLTAAACLLSVTGMPRITHADIMTTITFDEPGVPTGTLTNSSDFDVNGYHFNFTITEDASITGVGVGGTNAIQTQQDNELVFKITRIGGGAFTLDSFDLNLVDAFDAFLSLTGAKLIPDGGPGLINDYNTSTGGYVTIVPTTLSNFTSTPVTSVTFNFLPKGNGDSIAVDNIQLTAIPEPASMTLLGLGGLALLHRRRLG